MRTESPKNWIDEMIEREAVPREAREETTRDFCKKRGIDERTYYYTVRKKENQEQILAICLNNAKRETPEILKKLSENAKAGKEKSIEMYLKFIIELAEKTDITSKGDKIMYLPSELIEKNDIPQSSKDSSQKQ
jgi:hypothetical protein